ncbi:hypothetical protein GCM10010372_78790 [Streptomyces tauricus]|nr:hypothetical protein GCM10010372_78790 [Streptomyces tauricus]
MPGWEDQRRILARIRALIAWQLQPEASSAAAAPARLVLTVSNRTTTHSGRARAARAAHKPSRLRYRVQPFSRTPPLLKSYPCWERQ